MGLVEILSLPWVARTLMVTYALSIVTVIVVILGENRNPVKSLAWVTVLILMPLLGLVLYLFFGRNFKNKRMISRRNKRRLRRTERYRNAAEARDGLSAENRKIANVAYSIGGGEIYADNSVEIFTSGQTKFEALRHDLRRAKRFIHLQYYIFEDDTIGTEVRDILMERARAGVKVRVIYDHVGSMSVKKRFFREMQAAGVEVYPFFKVTFTMLGSRINWRNHRKVVVIDGEVGYIGGMNIADRYVDGGPKFDMWRDCHLRVMGPAVASLQYSFAVDWNFMGQPLLAEKCSTTPRGNCTVQTITTGPMSRWPGVAYAFQRAIASAKRRVYLQTPYFLPTDSLLHALQVAALSGVDVCLMVPRRSDSRLLDLASGSYITECLQSGVKVYFFEPGMLHSKTLIVDDEFASVGSTNFDFRSFECNFEANMLIYSKEFNERLTALFMLDLQQSSRVYPQRWHARSKVRRALESVVRLLSPIL
jgi:cardiolipin synthase